MAELDPTKERLLEAAGEEFAEKGFQGATIRSICTRAGANVAAVNYHFGDKEQLYVAAVLEAHRCNVGREDVPEGLEPAEELRLHIRHFLSHILAIGQIGDWHQTLMLREMLRPTLASDTLVRDVIRPKFERLKELLQRIKPGLEGRRLDAMVFTIIGQCLHYRVGRSIAERLIGPEAFAKLDVDFLTAHISGVTLAALTCEPDGQGVWASVTREGVS